MAAGLVAMAAFVPARGAGAARPSVAPRVDPRVDPRVQQAAVDAVGTSPLPVDLVAIRASTGEVLASVAHGQGLTAADPFTGRYPTGSTFKIVTAADLIEHGAAPDSPATCPASIAIGDKTLATFDGQPDPKVTTLAGAFAHSCNTAFGALGAKLPARSYVAAAARLGLGSAARVGRPAFLGKVGAAKSDYDRAVLASDGGRTLVSPLAMAMVAAGIDSGSFRAPRVLAAKPAGAPRPRRLPRAVAAGLRSMMAAAVTDGTASGQGLPVGTAAKTGTAEFPGAPAPQKVYAWLVGYRGDVAFAVLVVGGSQGGPVAGPVAARFLTELG